MNIDAVTSYSRAALKHYNNSENKKFLKAMQGFYTEGRKNPSNALIIMNSETRKFSERMLKEAKNMVSSFSTQNPNSCTDSLGENLELMVKASKSMDIIKNKILETLPEHKVFYDKFEKLYPKTKDIRTKINYLETGKVSPKKSWSEKYLYFYNTEEQKKKYPKTYMLRLRLLLENRITDGKVEPKMSNCIEKRNMKKIVF